jgi:glycosyltransferase involved in cell wall biosynthesis
MVFVFWQNMLTHLQAPWISRLAETPGVQVIVAAEERVAEWRQDMGWSEPSYGCVRVISPLTRDITAHVIGEAGGDALHIFSGFGAYRVIHEAFHECVARKVRIGIMAEQARTGGLVESLRLVAGHLRYLRHGRNVDFVLGIGAPALSWFGDIGFEARRVFEFCYFPPPPTMPEYADASLWHASGVRLLFIGQLIHRKGVDVMLNALSGLRSWDWSLAIIGGGPEKSRLLQMTRERGLGNRVHFCGALPHSQAMAGLQGADVLVLPSRFDGYGAVISEALLRGVPVICSDRCGARQVVTTETVGSVFRSGSVESLKEALIAWIDRGRLNDTRRRTIAAFAARFAPDAGADYFLKIIGHVYDGGPRPLPPWQSEVAPECAGDGSRLNAFRN